MRAFPRLLVLLAFGISAFAETGDQRTLLCAFDTNPPLPKPKEFRVVRNNLSGDGDKSQPIGHGFLPSKSTLDVEVGPSGDITGFVVVGVSVPMSALLRPGPGISVQMGMKNPDNHTRDILKMSAVKTAQGYTFFVRSITSAGLFMNPTRDDVWKLSKKPNGQWGFEMPSVRSGPTRYATTVTVNLTPKDTGDPGNGLFKGVQGYAYTDGSPSTTMVATQAGDDIALTNSSNVATTAPDAR